MRDVMYSLWRVVLVIEWLAIVPLLWWSAFHPIDHIDRATPFVVRIVINVVLTGLLVVVTALFYLIRERK